MDLLSDAPLTSQVLFDPALVHTRWLEVTPQPETTEAAVIEYLQSHSAMIGSEAQTVEASAVSIAIPIRWKKLAAFLTMDTWQPTHIRLDKVVQHAVPFRTQLSSRLEIHKLAPAHLLSVEPLFVEQATFHASLYSTYYRAPTAIDWTTYRTELSDDFSAPNALNFVCMSGSVPVGMIVARSTAENITVYDIIVSEKFRGKGIGTALLAELDSTAKNNAVPLTLETWWNQPARELYEKSGFVSVAQSYFKSI